jgi:hypothetical protein
MKKSDKQMCIDAVTKYGVIIGIMDTAFLVFCLGSIVWVSQGGYNPKYFTLWQITNAGAIFSIILLATLAIGFFVGGVLYPELNESKGQENEQLT